uniref:Uncharacterized protein n=1 Tax=Glossina pallidipes TaxID=7398 RepID=A0A1A9ZEY6_GLOPL
MSSLSKELFRRRGWLHLSSTLPLSRACSLFLSLYSAPNRLISLKAMNVVCVLHEIVGVDFFFNPLEFLVICVEFSGDGRKLKDELALSFNEVHCLAAVNVAGSAPVLESVLALGAPSFPLRFEYERWKLPKCSSDDKEDECLRFAWFLDGIAGTLRIRCNCCFFKALYIFFMANLSLRKSDVIASGRMHIVLCHAELCANKRNRSRMKCMRFTLVGAKLFKIEEYVVPSGKGYLETIVYQLTAIAMILAIKQVDALWDF